MIRLLLVDDHPIVRAGLRALLDSEVDLDVIGECATAEEALALVPSTPVDLVLLDLQFPGAMQGVEATRRLRDLDSPPYVLILTNYGTDNDILGAIEAGASGYLLKDAPPGDILGAVRAAAQGESALAPTVVSRLMQRVRTPGDTLSSREIEVLQLVADGRSNAEIGAELFLTESTVKSHLVHVFGKLRVTSRTSAVAAARENGLIR